MCGWTYEREHGCGAWGTACRFSICPVKPRCMRNDTLKCVYDEQRHPRASTRNQPGGASQGREELEALHQGIPSRLSRSRRYACATRAQIMLVLRIGYIVFISPLSCVVIAVSQTIRAPEQLQVRPYLSTITAMNGTQFRYACNISSRLRERFRLYKPVVFEQHGRTCTCQARG